MSEKSQAKQENIPVILKEMTERSLKKFNKTEAQGWIINSAIRIEGYIDSILLRFFKPENSEIFYNIALNSSVMHYGGKLKILKAIGIDNGPYSDLQGIGSIRNSFAHTNITNRMSLNFKKTPGKVETEVSDIMSVMNSQGVLNSKDPYEFLKEFLILYQRVEPVLEGKIKELEKP